MAITTGRGIPNVNQLLAEIGAVVSLQNGGEVHCTLSSGNKYIQIQSFAFYQDVTDDTEPFTVVKQCDHFR